MDSLVAPALEVINRRACEPRFRLTDLAKELCVREQRLSHTLAGVTGYGFPALVNGVRLEKAGSLLQTTNMPVTQIAILVGYETCRNLDRHFSLRFGMTPKQYRRYSRDFRTTLSVTKET